MVPPVIRRRRCGPAPFKKPIDMGGGGCGDENGGGRWPATLQPAPFAISIARHRSLAEPSGPRTCISVITPFCDRESVLNLTLSLDQDRAVPAAIIGSPVGEAEDVRPQCEWTGIMRMHIAYNIL